MHYTRKIAESHGNAKKKDFSLELDRTVFVIPVVSRLVYTGICINTRYIVSGSFALAVVDLLVHR